MKCSHCKKDFEESKIHEHHIHPRFMDNPKGCGMKIYICEKCHNIVHLIIPKFIWEELTNIQREIITKKIISYSKKYGGLK